MSFHQRPEITADDVHKAGDVLDQLVGRAAVEAVNSPAFDQLAAAKREPDRTKRLARISQALKQGAKDARAAQQRLQQSRRVAGADSGEQSFTREAWNALVGDGSPFLEWDFLASLEASGCLGRRRLAG